MTAEMWFGAAIIVALQLARAALRWLFATTPEPVASRPVGTVLYRAEPERRLDIRPALERDDAARWN